MIKRKLQSPGVEINEFDRSNYEQIDYSLPNSPTSLIFGFASNGEDSAFKWINSFATLNETFGQPTTEFEAYFYNAATEILNRGGTCIAARLPYANESYQKYNYVEYSIGDLSNTFNTSLNVNQIYNTIENIKDTYNAVLNQLGQPTKNIKTIAELRNNIYSTINEYSSNDIEIPESIESIKTLLTDFISSYSNTSPYNILFENDMNLTSVIDITYKKSGKDSLENFDDYLTKSQTIKRDSIRIYDITRSQYESLNSSDHIIYSDGKYSNDFLGLVPVITTPLNAMFFQNVLHYTQDAADIDYSIFNSIAAFDTIEHKDVNSDELKNFNNYSTIPLSSNKFDEHDTTVYDNQSLSRMAAMQFPELNFNGNANFDSTYLKQIGVVVFKAYKDMDNNGKVSFQLLESFVGSLDKRARDQITKASIFIDDIVNNNSKYIRIFSNADRQKIEKTSTIVMSSQKAISLGFYNIDSAKIIEYDRSIMKPLTYLLDVGANTYDLPLDLLIDAGISNIAFLAMRQIDTKLNTDNQPKFSDYANASLSIDKNISGWTAILRKFDNFCKNKRKDCMFLVDGLRSFCLDGDQKFVRKTMPQNTVANSIICNLKYMTGILNSSYSAGYCNWFYQPDYSKMYDYIWIPPSIKAAGVYTHCSVYAHPWAAPAGVNRGRIPDAIDVAFISMEADAGKIYSNEWNYAMSYPIDGIIIEGHKTFQMQRTALDRVNVRRLLLWLEKQVAQLARQFVYEGNTPYLRQLFVDTIKPIFEKAVMGNGLLEYGVKCDDELNTSNVIENNELRCKIAVKPVKVVDWIVIDLISTRQSASISEELIR